ncbi:MAG: response regulator [Candidatus Eisenbacteria bacterium]|uniref:Response regulator n=1 Tax=Eiseniibacteriota bacterium TaxID=2212470 RepID=A0A956N7T3_UNCEI|nr:response regulator [Candidatus Eisenbacteria bacterium]MCB9463006.1 response regulator [Candidatus Eisenbacteria bacterium]
MNSTVFILDDETLLLRTLSNALRDEDFRVLSAQRVTDGREVLAMDGEDVELMVLDVKLPDGSGLDLLEQQRKSGYSGPVIVMTAFDNPESERRCRQLSVDHYIRKPFDLGEILGLVQELTRGNGIRLGADGTGSR